MSRPYTNTACLLAGFVIAAMAVGSASAAKPIAGTKPEAAKQPLSIKQKNDLAKAMARPNAAKAAPSKAARAKSATSVAPGGDETSVLPEELYHYLTATPDANGRMRVRDFDPSAQPAAAVEATHDK